MTTKTAKSGSTAKSPIIFMAEDIVLMANKPMSPDQIKGRFQLEFPFSVKRVIESPDNGHCPCMREGMRQGVILTFTGLHRKGCYIYGKCGCGQGEDLAIHPDSERFVLV